MTKRVLRKLGVAHVRWLRPSYSSLDDMIGAGARPRVFRRTGAEHPLPLQRSDRRRQPVQPDRRRARRLLRSSRALLRLRAHVPEGQTGHLCRVRGRVHSQRLTIVHLTPHLPPDQAANALLPFQLGEWAKTRGDCVHFIAHPPASGEAPRLANVTWIPRTERTAMQRLLRTGSIAGAIRIRRDAADIIRRRGRRPRAQQRTARGSGCAPRARQFGKPVVLTLYGTEIWHYRPRRIGPDLFTRAYRSADAVTFYSQRLLDRANEFGLARPGMPRGVSARRGVVRVSRRGRTGGGPPFARHHRLAAARQRQAPPSARRASATRSRRCRPIVARYPDAELVICGTGALLAELQAVARSAGVERHVRFAGLVENAVVARYCAAADLFVLPSVLEALPTVAVEALARGHTRRLGRQPGRRGAERRVW